MKILIFASLLVACQASSLLENWTTFKQVHGKAYLNHYEDNYRMGIFEKNRKMIDEHNEKYEKGLVSYSLKMNHYGDLAPEEFKQKMNQFKGSDGQNLNSQVSESTNVDIPSTFDWREKGAVTPVKDQGYCGSCWAFSATGSLEGQHFLKTGNLVSLSEQNLIDCSGSYGNAGCGGGLMEAAFRYIHSNGGIDTEKSYPYEEKNGMCRFNRNYVGATLRYHINLPTGDEQSLQKAIASVGPISVAMDAGERSFQFYSKGIYYDNSCSSKYLDHGVLAVGYGSDNGEDYWLIKNSWNSTWGENGYFRVARNKNNHCGIATAASYPVV